jgi:hypothetical protein
MVKDVRVGMGRILKVLIGGARVDAEVVVILELEVELDAAKVGVDKEEAEEEDETDRTMRLVIGSAV